MFIFLLIYLSSFALAVKGIIKNNRQDIFLFLIFGLCIYNTSLSIAFSTGLIELVGIFKAFKEIIIVILLCLQIFTLKKKTTFHFIDVAILAYFFYTLLYVLVPIGNTGFADRLSSFKNIAFFPLVYYCGRLFAIQHIYISKYFHFILYVTIAATLLVIYEFVTYQHFQTYTGFADYQYYFYDFEPTGSYGLTYTFEAESGMKRFASFFSGPLELAEATLLALAVIAALYTTTKNKFKFTTFGIIALVATQICIFLAISRSAFLSYFLMIYVFALITRKRYILHFIHFCFLSGVIYFLYLLEDRDMQEFIISTLKFTNASSVGHLMEWIEGINAMIAHPLGLGLGSSGIVAGSLGQNVGGENEFIIIGVQTGIIACALYLTVYISLIWASWRWFPKLRTKERKVCLLVLLTKVGFFIPLLTSELELSAYISYITWFFCGLFINSIMKKRGVVNTA